MSDYKVTVTVSDDYLHRFSEVVERTKEAGLSVEREMEGIGTLSGSIDPSTVDSLLQLEGVAAVEHEEVFQLPPPDMLDYEVYTAPDETGGTAMSSQKVNISVADDYLSRFQEVVQQTKDVGLNVEQELDGLGIISGSIDPGRLADLERLEGVSAVEADRIIQLPPPDSDVQ